MDGLTDLVVKAERKAAEHRLVVHSQDAADVQCACGDWSMVATGYRSMQYIEEEFQRHLLAVSGSLVSAPGHTAGPWHLTEMYAGRDGHVVGVYSGNCAAIAEVHLTAVTDRRDVLNPEAENLANAALVAAAPDLLQALEGLFQHCAMIHKHWGENSNAQEAESARKFAQAAISKAKGA